MRVRESDVRAMTEEQLIELMGLCITYLPEARIYEVLDESLNRGQRIDLSKRWEKG
jgi:hypothetical protein